MLPLLAAAALAAAPCSAPEYRQLDFWVGDWDLVYMAAPGKAGHASNHVTRDEFGGCVVAEHFSQPSAGLKGASWSVYDAQLGKWRQTWVDSSGAVFVLVGGPVTGQAYSFELVTTEPRGPDHTLKRMIWQDVTPDRLTWRWQTQDEGGAWKDSWVLHYDRRR